MHRAVVFVFLVVLLVFGWRDRDKTGPERPIRHPQDVIARGSFRSFLKLELFLYGDLVVFVCAKENFAPDGSQRNVWRGFAPGGTRGRHVRQIRNDSRR